MLFVKALWSAVQSSSARGVKPDMDDYKPLQPGEVVIGTITSPDLLALVAIRDDNQAEFFLRWPTPPTNAVAMGSALSFGAETEALRDLVNLEIRRAFSMGPEDPVILRQGYGGPVVVKVPHDVPPNGLTVAAIETVREVRKVAIAKSLQQELEAVAADSGCGNPGCPVCGTVARLGRIDAAFASAIQAVEALS
jgi:hypothetical protein